ncbi:MAG TPA: S41 family peptidase [Chitinophagaceae bacterium]|nr:S41 family peptidase [Chitinophagaceae bacterium]
MKFLLLVINLFCLLQLSAQNTQYKNDFIFFWNTINANYCYWDKKQTDWNNVKNTYSALMDSITSRNGFVSLLEQVFYELYDHHASLNTNTLASQRLVPSGTDIWAEYVNGKPVIIEIKAGSGSAKAGLKAGMEIVSLNDIPIATALLPFLPRHIKRSDPEATNYALRVALAGSHSMNRKIVAGHHAHPLTYYPDQPVNLLERNEPKNKIESTVLPGNIGYILINNALGDNALIAVFDSVLTGLKTTKAMILDLRNTPGGGNTTVARSIIGRFIDKDGFYQKHELTAEQKEFGVKRSWVEVVSSRPPVYTKPLAILVDHWTGSVGEGIAIGFDAVKRATIIGTPMAGLNGANYFFTMPGTGIGFSFPAEKLYHINGTPRENFRPTIQVNTAGTKNNEDIILQQALKHLNKKNN